MYTDLLNNSNKFISSLGSLGLISASPRKPNLSSFRAIQELLEEEPEIAKPKRKTKKEGFVAVKKRKLLLPKPKEPKKPKSAFPVKLKLPHQTISAFQSTAQKSALKMNSSKVFINPNYIDQVFDFDSDPEAEDRWLIKQLNQSQDSSLKAKLSFFSHQQRGSEKSQYIGFKNIVDMEEHRELIQSQKYQKKYTCDYCQQVFDSGCALGGHISKIHRDGVKKYKKKINQRNA